MGAVMAYSIKAACCLAAFYLFYKWLLSKETFHHFNRFALLSLLIITAILPFVQISLQSEHYQAQVMVGNLVMQIVNGTNNTLSFQWQWLLIIIYLIGIVLYAIRTFVSYIKLYCTIHKLPSSPLPEDSHIRLILLDKEINPFSWMHYIVISKSDYEENGTAIITHERAHISYIHSLDIFIADICIMFQWFNPAAWLIKKELQNIHEYEADEVVVNAGVNAKNYQLLLIKKAVGTRLYSMVNSLNHSSLKKRITMMLKEKSNPWARLKYAYVLPLAAISIAAFASTEVSNPLERLSDAKVSDLSHYLSQNANKFDESATSIIFNGSPEAQKPKTKKVKISPDKNGVYQMAEVLPNYPGGVSAMMKYLTINMKYPQEAVKKHIEGRVIVQFVVDKDGTVRNANVVRSIPELDKEAIRIVEAMPKWRPGKQDGKNVKVGFTLPITFKLDGNKHEVALTETSPKAYDVVEEQPCFMGGQHKMFEYFASHLKYPAAAQKDKMQGKVIIQFVVGKDGDISSARVVRSIREDLDNEALRVINSMPRWQPGKMEGKNVAVKFTVPFTFKLDNEKAPLTEGADDGVVVVGYGNK
jgi:TonB family protein